MLPYRSTTNCPLSFPQGKSLLGSMSSQTRPDSSGKLLLKLNEGVCRLPDLVITDKNDTFRKEGQNYSTFRIMAQAVQRDQDGSLSVPDNISPAISSRLVVRTMEINFIIIIRPERPQSA